MLSGFVEVVDQEGDVVAGHDCGIGIEKARELMKEVRPGMKKLAGQSITPVITLKSETEGELRGTGLLLRSGERIYLTSASHVLRGDTGLAVMLTSEFPTQVKGTLHATGWPIDLAAIELSDLIPDPRDLLADIAPISEVFLNDDDKTRGDIYFLCGFPQDRSRFTAFIPGVLSEITPITTVLGSTTSIAHYDPRFHFLTDYPLVGEDEKGNPVDLPDPHGLSGSPIWNTRRLELGESWTAASARVVGIAHSWDPDGKVLVCTRISHLKRLILRASR